jgi:hypothetical protein
MADKSQQILRWISSLIGATSCWWMAYSIYQAYNSRQQQVFGIPIIALYLLEFILVHAGSIPMIAASKESKSSKIITVSLVSAIYVTFIATAAFRFHSSQLLLTFAGIMIPRWTGLFTDSDAARQQQINRSLESVLAFVFTIVPIVLLTNSSNPFGLALIPYFAAMGLLEGTSPLRKKSLDQSQRAGCFIAAAAFILVIIIVGGAFLKMILESFHKA